MAPVVSVMGTDASASTYTNDPYRCPQPTVKVTNNVSHIAVRVRAWSEEVTDVPDAFNKGRSQFTFATFNASAWAAVSSVHADDALGALAKKDALLYEGACALEAAAKATLAARVDNLREGMSTADLRAYTAQAAGCRCAALVLRSNGVYEISNACESDAPLDDQDHKVFWVAPNGWALRQTTCGADADDECAFPGSPAFAGVAAANCTLRTDGLLVIGMGTFQTAVSEGPSTMGSVMKTTWSLRTVELASTAAVNAPGSDVIETRTTTNAYSNVIYPAGAVVETLAVGDMAPPLILTVRDVSIKTQKSSRFPVPPPPRTPTQERCAPIRGTGARRAYARRAALLGGGSGGRGTLPPGIEKFRLRCSFPGGRAPTQEGCAPYRPRLGYGYPAREKSRLRWALSTYTLGSQRTGLTLFGEQHRDAQVLALRDGHVYRRAPGLRGGERFMSTTVGRKELRRSDAEVTHVVFAVEGSSRVQEFHHTRSV